jgi:signal transduction histidine kinase
MSAESTSPRPDAVEGNLSTMAGELADCRAEVEHFISAAAHELKAPLRAMINLSGWIAEDLGTGATPGVAENLALLKQRGERLGRLLDDLLAFARCGTEAYELAEVDLGRLCSEILEDFPVREGFTVQLSLPIQAFRARRIPLKMVLERLLSNAIKHHHLQKGIIQVSARDLGSRVEVSVKDDGPGIEPRHQERIFQVFQTLKSKDEVEGNGVGLALVKKILNRFGGSIALDSVPGKGSEFRITWPKGA